jgi:hypothetical protein
LHAVDAASAAADKASEAKARWRMGPSATTGSEEASVVGARSVGCGGDHEGMRRPDHRRCGRTDRSTETETSSARRAIIHIDGSAAIFQTLRRAGPASRPQEIPQAADVSIS